MIKVCPTCQQRFPDDTEFCAQDGTRLVELGDDQNDPLLGRVLDDRWVIHDRIGEGGMGSVYRASQRRMNREVAVKTLKPELSNSREFVDRFFQEARVASTIAHPHCVTIHDFGQTDDGLLFLAMEFLDGIPLSDRLQHPDLSVAEIIQICIQIASALAAAHDNNVIHRDLKPDNVFLLSISDGSTFTKVLDFGIAKVTDSDEKMTKTGQVFGTPEYMSPEQCRGGQLDGRSDLYSLGCILYRMLGGHPPFQSDTPMAVLVSHVNEDVPPISQALIRDDIPDALADLCMQLLAKDPDGRPDDAQTVRAQLESIVNAGHTNPVGAVTPSPALSDEDVSGPTLAVDTGEAPQVDESDDDTGGEPADQPTDHPPQPDDQPASKMRTAGDDGLTGTPAAVDAPRRNPWPLIIGVGLAALLSAGCVVGGVYFFYVDGPDQGGQSFDVFALFDQKTDADGSTSADNSSTTSDTGEPNASAQTADNPGSAPVAADAASARSSNSDTSTTNATAGPGGAKMADNRRHAAAGAGSAGVGDSDGHPQPSRDSTTTTANPDPGSTKTNIPTDSAAASSSPSSTETAEIETAETATAETETAHTTQRPTQSGSTAADPNQKPAGNDAAAAADTPDTPDHGGASSAGGDIRRTRLQTTGDACIDSDIEHILNAAANNFLGCYRAASSSGLSGKVILAWNISTNGDLIRPDVLVSEVGPINSCLLGELDQLNFDSPDGGRCYVRATFQFSR